MKAIDLKTVINSKLLFVSHKNTIRETVLLMRQEQKSSVLVFDDQDKVVGIVTERDIVQKFTPIDYELKSDMLINTLMTRPVKFVRLAFIYEDMNRLHLQHGLRHFPVKEEDKPATKANVVGLITATDIFRLFLEKAQSLLKRNAKEVEVKKVVNITPEEATHMRLNQIINGLGCEPLSRPDWQNYLQAEDKGKDIIIHDFDGASVEENAAIVKLLKDRKGPVIFLTSEPKLIPQFRKNLDEHKRIFAKPIDLSYLMWIINYKFQNA